MRGSSFGKLAIAGANISRAASLWAITLVIARFGGVAGLGEFAFALAITSPVFIFAQLGLRNVYITLHRVPRLADMVMLRVLCLTLASMTVVALALLPGGPALGMSLALSAAKTADALVDIFQGSLHRAERLTVVGSTTAINGATVLLAVAVVMFASGSIVLAVAAWAGVSLVTCCAVLPLAVARERRLIRSEATTWATRSSVVKAGLPVGGTQAVGSLFTYLPIAALGVWAAAEDVGVFTALMYFLTFTNLGLASIQQAMLPGLVASVRSKRISPSTVRRYALLFSGFSVLAGLLIGVLGSPILEYVYGDQFVVNSAVILVVALASAFLGVVYSSEGRLLAINAYGGQFGVTLCALAVMAACLMFLFGAGGVESISLLGVAGSVLVSTVARAVGGLALARRLERHRCAGGK